MNCEHEWKEADCENPKMCQLCGSTEGEKGGHTWKNASCTMSKTCSICGLSEGEPLSSNKTHTWQDATCVNPKMCTVCGESEGQALGHSAGDWQITDEGTCEEQGTKQQMCVVCENSEQTVKNILSDISLELQKQDFKAEVVFAFGDVEEESDGECLAIGEIDVDGEYTVQSMSREFI